jgi:hypothetical protein
VRGTAWCGMLRMHWEAWETGRECLVRGAVSGGSCCHLPLRATSNGARCCERLVAGSAAEIGGATAAASLPPTQCARGVARKPITR